MQRTQILFLLFVFMVFRGKFHLHRLFCTDINHLLFRNCSVASYNKLEVNHLTTFLTPRYSWTIANVGVKYQSINQSINQSIENVKTRSIFLFIVGNPILIALRFSPLINRVAIHMKTVLSNLFRKNSLYSLVSIATQHHSNFILDGLNGLQILGVVVVVIVW